jgi:GNAT superfamily N-acetyltransferase
MTKSILDVERCALAAWPAEHVEELAGWQLRAMSGVTRRANSVWACEASGELSIDERVERAEHFYEARGLPALFHISPASQPLGLDRALERRGYVIDAPVSVQVAAPSEVCQRAKPSGAARIELARAPTEPWLEVSARKGRYAADEAVYRRLLHRLGASAHYALARVAGVPAAVALGTVRGDWFGVCSMLTLPGQRRTGLARALLSTLAGRALELGCHSLYLQVELENTAALALYEGLGFQNLYRTHYRLRPNAKSEHVGQPP